MHQHPPDRVVQCIPDACLYVVSDSDSTSACCVHQQYVSLPQEQQVCLPPVTCDAQMQGCACENAVKEGGPIRHPLVARVRQCSVNPDAAVEFFRLLFTIKPEERRLHDIIDSAYLAATSDAMFRGVLPPPNTYSSEGEHSSPVGAFQFSSPSPSVACHVTAVESVPHGLARSTSIVVGNRHGLCDGSLTHCCGCGVSSGEESSDDDDDDGDDDDDDDSVSSDNESSQQLPDELSTCTTPLMPEDPCCLPKSGFVPIQQQPSK